MKCPKCTRNHKHSAGMKCNCGYHFTLNPKVDGISDGRFISFIKGASCNGTYRFTENQLYTAACRKQVASIGFLILAGIMAAMYTVFGCLVNPIVFLLQIVPVIMVAVWYYFRFERGLPREKFDGWLEKYVHWQGPLEGLLKDGEFAEAPEPPTDSDVYDYGVERVLIVERESLVDLLVANNIHLTNRAVIATADGYPAYLASMVNKLLDESPELPVFLLHDSTDEGLAWAVTQTKKYETPKRKVIDMGIGPDSLKRIRKLSPVLLKKLDWRAPLDMLPMAMLDSGIALSMDQEIGMEDLLVMETSPDSTTSFG